MIFKALFFISLIVGNIMGNQLSNETSPYLLQHKDNPVNWYPWSNKAFELAQKENKLIFLSIGYSTCHWCHVMAHESFEDEEVAKILNKDFISIKVDREQLPHIDGFYQKVYRLMNERGGGWPLTIMMTANKEPFFAGTYIPKYAGYGSKGLIPIIQEVVKADRKLLKDHGQEVLKVMKQKENFTPSSTSYESEIEKKIVEQLYASFDPKYKGFGSHPKFPQFVNIILLLKVYMIDQNKEALKIATESLKAMANGGIFDQIEGGFYRYSVDQRWAIPHFEKMLYTNAEALEAYTLAYKITKKPIFLEVIDRTIKEMDRRFLVDGVYQSASNADSKNDLGINEEGAYFVFDYESTLHFFTDNGFDKKEAVDTLHYFGIVEDGNFDGSSSNPEILDNAKPIQYEKALELLQQIRSTKEYPFIDNKINTAWNALYIKGKLIASILDDQYLQSSLKSLDALIDLMYKDEQLYHQTIIGKQPAQQAILEDYSFLISTLFEAYQITLDEKYFKFYEALLLKSIELFYKEGRWSESNDGFETYADIEDAGYASALGVQFNNLILYATMQGDYKIFEIAKRSMQYFTDHINKYPSYFPNTTMASLYFTIEPIFIKSTKENLHKIDKLDLQYPFIYKKVYDSQEYLACKLNSCFSYSKDIKKVVQDIDNLVQR